MLNFSHKILIITKLLLILIATKSFADYKPCLSRSIPGESVVCVCTETYCDNVIREQPTSEKYITYTSSKAGSRFKKSKGTFRLNYIENVSISLELDPETMYQTIEGFGGAVTDSAGINWKNMSEALQEYLIKSYFSDWGLQYNMLRVPIGGCDFSTHPYAYNEYPQNDSRLSNYTLSYEDYQYKIPMIKAAMDASSSRIHIVATTWSPPPWMKDNNEFSGTSHLKREYYQTYADYHYKFLEKYSQEGIQIWAITTTNEPIDGVLSIVAFNDLGWTAVDMGYWIENNLGPTIRNSTFKNLKIISVDDQRFTVPYWFNELINKHPNALQYIDGVGVHFYGDKITPPELLKVITDLHPDKFILATEASIGSLPFEKKVVIGSWDRAKTYILDIIIDLTYNIIGWLDWNLCLNEQGGPNWVSNFVDSPILVFPEKKEFIKQPMFYALGHFSKFVPRGSRRIKVTGPKDEKTLDVQYIAFLTPQNTVVVVLYNDSNENTKVGVKLSEKHATLAMEAHSIMTVECQYDY